MELTPLCLQTMTEDGHIAPPCCARTNTFAAFMLHCCWHELAMAQHLSKRSPCEQPALLLCRVVAVCHPEGAYTLHGYHMVARALGLRPKRVLQIMILPSTAVMFHTQE